MSLVDKPKVSVCVATYNHERYIRDCLLSVLTQSRNDGLEVLVGDDASTDRTPEIIREIAEKYPGIVKFIHNETNKGGCANYQFLISRAEGDYIAHLDGDDYWLPGKIEAQLEFLESHNDVVAVFTNALVVTEDNREWGIFNNPQPELIDQEYLMLKGNFLNHSSIMYRSSLKHEILTLGSQFVDYRIHIRLSKHGLLGYINNALVAYRINAVNSIVGRQPELVMELIYEALSEIDGTPRLKRAALRAHARFYGDILSRSFTFRRINYGIDWGRRLLVKFGIVDFLIIFLFALHHLAGMALLKKAPQIVRCKKSRIAFKR